MTSDKNIIIGIIILLLGIGVILFIVSSSSSSRENNTSLDLASPVAQFAQCLTDHNVVFYGAFWCPHCQAQKKLFGSAAKLLNYIECSTLDGNQQTQICKDKGIKSYPTWDFVDGTRIEGEMTFEKLAEKTGCPTPGSSEGLKTATTSNNNQ